MTYGKICLLGFFMLATAALYAWFGPSRYGVVWNGKGASMYDKYTNERWNYIIESSRDNPEFGRDEYISHWVRPRDLDLQKEKE